MASLFAPDDRFEVCCADLRVLFVCPVLQSEFQQRVINTLWRTGVHFDHVLQECFQLFGVVGKNWDEFLRVGLKRKKKKK